MAFFEKMTETHNSRKTLTENGAVAYATSGKELLDMNFHISALRNSSVDEIKAFFTRAYFENPLLAVKFMFYVGDVREGIGERKVFRACIEWMEENRPEELILVMHLIAHYNRWDTLVKLCKSENTDVRACAINIVFKQFYEDVANDEEDKNISLLAKWMPSINTSSKESRALANHLCDYLIIDHSEYRKTLSRLRKRLDIVERKASSGEWGEIDYEKVPSKANLMYSNAFMNHDKKRREAYLESLKKGDAKINNEIKGIDEFFVTSRLSHLLYPRDTHHGADLNEIINCRLGRDF